VNSSEFLNYQLSHPICIVSALVIEFYRASWQEGRPVYCPKVIRASFYLGSNLQCTITLGHVQRLAIPQTFTLPRPIVANLVRIHLDGRTARQPSDDLWYTVVQHVNILGYSLRSFADRGLCQSLINYAHKFITQEDLKAARYSSTEKFAQTCEFYLSCKCKIRQ